MFDSAVSRWTMLHFAVAISFFLLAQLAMAAGIAFPIVPLFAPTTLATVHLLTIGWLTILMLGALHQFVPVITARGSVAGTSALISLTAILAGLGGMELGFFALDGRLPASAIRALPIGGVLVLIGVSVAGASLAQILWRTRPLPFAARFVAIGLVFLFAAIGLGILFGTAFASPILVGWFDASAGWLRLHLLAGLIGWFTLTAMGVSYRLLSMFTLAPEERGTLGIIVFALSAGGLAATWIFGIIVAMGVTVPSAASTAAIVVTGLGVALYLFDMMRLYRGRRRQKLELNAGMAIPAFASLGISLIFAFCAALNAKAETFAGPIGYLFLFGWLSGLALSQLYKIVPFMTWLERYGQLLGKQPVPRVQDLVDESRDRLWFILYFVAVAAGTLFGAFGWATLWRVAIVGHLVASVMIVRALWLVRKGTPRQGHPIATRLSAMSSPPLAANLKTTE